MREIIGVIVAFALIFWLSSRRMQLGLIMLISSTVLGLFAGGFERPLGLLTTFYRALTARDTIELAVIVALITALARVMGDFGLLQAMSQALARLLRSTKLSLALVPGVVGCLPVMGGAIVSAPMVDALGDRLDIDRERKSAINVIFRHAWFFVFPFSTSLVLLARLDAVDVFGLIRLQWPISVAALVSGYLYFFGRLPRESTLGVGYRFWPGLRDFLVTGAPLLTAIILGVGLPIPFYGLFRLPLWAALAVGIVVGMALGRRHPKFRWDLPLRGVNWPMVGTMAGVMVFLWAVKGVTIFPTMIEWLTGNGVPLSLLCVIIPLVIGLASAAQATTIAMTVPVLLATVPTPDKPLYAMLIYASSYVAYVASPLHLCQIFSVQYFRADLTKVYRHYVIPLSAVLVTMAIIYFIAR
ncbi:MAG TPA: DUF401 family protein [Bacillota bacterium]|jgi:hypothetical protein